MPFEVQHLHNVLGYGRRTALGPKDTVKQVYDRNVNGVKVKCVLISHQENHNRVVCLDASTGALVRQTPFLDREVTIVGAKLFPRFLSYVENGKSRAEVVGDRTQDNRTVAAIRLRAANRSGFKPGLLKP